MGGTQCPTSNRMDGKLVIITGASSGTGLETCKEIAARGENTKPKYTNLSNVFSKWIYLKVHM